MSVTKQQAVLVEDAAVQLFKDMVDAGVAIDAVSGVFVMQAALASQFRGCDRDTFLSLCAYTWDSAAARPRR